MILSTLFYCCSNVYIFFTTKNAVKKRDSGKLDWLTVVINLDKLYNVYGRNMIDNGVLLFRINWVCFFWEITIKKTEQVYNCRKVFDRISIYNEILKLYLVFGRFLGYFFQLTILFVIGCELPLPVAIGTDRGWVGTCVIWYHALTGCVSCVTGGKWLNWAY